MAPDIREIKTPTAGMMQILASHDNHMLRMEMRLERIERRLDLADPAIRRSLTRFVSMLQNPVGVAIFGLRPCTTDMGEP